MNRTLGDREKAMVAAARLAAHYVDAALKAGVDEDEDDPDAGSQAAPFASLLDGTETMVVQEPRPRALDGMVFQYVGVPGVDQTRIVQMGVPVGG